MRKIHRKRPVSDFLLKQSYRSEPRNFIKKVLRHRFFLVNFAIFLGTPILQNIRERLSLHIRDIIPVYLLRKTTFSTKKKQTNKEGIFLMPSIFIFNIFALFCFYWATVSWSLVQCNNLTQKIQCYIVGYINFF